MWAGTRDEIFQHNRPMRTWTIPVYREFRGDLIDGDFKARVLTRFPIAGSGPSADGPSGGQSIA